MPSDISSFILVSKVNTKHQVSKWSCLVKKMRTLYTLIDSTYVIRIVKLISFMLMNNIDTKNFGIPKNWLYLLQMKMFRYVQIKLSTTYNASHQESLRCSCHCKTDVLKLFAFVCGLFSGAPITDQHFRWRSFDIGTSNDNTI